MINLKNSVLDIIKGEDKIVKDSKKTPTSFYMRKTTLISTLQSANLQSHINRTNNMSAKELTMKKVSSNKSLNNPQKSEEITNKIIKVVEKGFEENKKTTTMLKTILKTNNNANDDIYGLAKKPKDENILNKLNDFSVDNIKKIYNITPFVGFLNNKVNLLAFQEKTNINTSSNSNNVSSKYILNEMSEDNLNLIKRLPLSSLGKDEKIVSLYQNTSTNNEFFNNEENYFDFNREYSYKEANFSEVYNSLILAVSKKDNSAFYIPIDSKFTLKKYVQPTSTESNLNDDLILNKKRQKFILKGLNSNETIVDEVNNLFKKQGFNLKKNISLNKKKKAVNNKIDLDIFEGKDENNRERKNTNMDKNDLSLKEDNIADNKEEDVDDLLFG